MPNQPAGALIVVPAKVPGRWFWEAKWRASGRQVKARLGPAHVEPRDEPLEGAEGWSRTYRKRRGRPDPGTLTADDAAIAMRAVIKAHAERIERPKDMRVPTFGEVADQWLEDRRAEVADGELKASTVKDYASMLKRPSDPVQRRGRGRTAHVQRAFERRSTDSITADDLDAFARKLRAAGLAPQTRKKYETVVSMILDFAVARSYIPANPGSARPKAKRKRKRTPAISVYSVETVEQIAGEAGGQTGEIIRLAAMTGLRQGELLGLRWADVDWVAQAVIVRRTWTAGLGEDVPKSGKARTVPLSDQAGVVLDRVSRREEFTRKGDLVFPNVAGEHTDASTLRRAYVKARNVVIAEAAEEGDELPRRTFHDLRDVFGSQCAAAGVPLVTIMTWMGHADIATTMIYLHFMPQADDAARLTRAFAGPIQTEETTADVG